MPERLHSPEDLADLLQLPDAKKALRLTRDLDWPHVRLTTKTIRYTDADIEEIVRRHHQASAPERVAPVVGFPGQTARSRAAAERHKPRRPAGS